MYIYIARLSVPPNEARYVDGLQLEFSLWPKLAQDAEPVGLDVEARSPREERKACVDLGGRGGG